MKAFRFHLARVWHWQLTVCQVKEGEVRQVLSEIGGIDARVAELGAACVAAERDVLNHQALAAADLTALAQFRLRAAADQKSLSIRRASRLRDLESARASLMTERRQYRLLEKLRERALLAHTAEADREAETLAAEAYASRWISELPARQGPKSDGRPVSPAE